MGNEISKAIEADLAGSPQGVVAEKLAAAGSSAARRGARDVAERERVFAFCADWDLPQLTDFLRWYERCHARQSTSADLKALDLRGLAQQVDALERDVATRQALLRDVDEELRALDEQPRDEHESEEQELVRATLAFRRDELLDELRAAQRALQDRKVHLLATLDGVDLGRAVTWPAFLHAASHVQSRTTLQVAAEAHSAWHPAAVGYAMARDAGAKKELGEYAKGDVLLPPPANHEIDGHTDDSASSSAASDDNGGSDGGEEDSEDDENLDAQGYDAALGEAKVGGENDAGGGEERATRRDPGDGEDDEDEEDDDDDDDEKDDDANKNESAAAGDLVGGVEPMALTADALAEHTEVTAPSESPTVAFQSAMKRPRVVKRAVPAAFDAATRSPVFFGYSLEKRKDELVEAVSADDALIAKENTIFEQKIQRRKSQLEDTLKAERGKLDVISQREADVKQKRERYWEKRDADLERAKRELDPNDIFFRTREIQDKKTRDNQAFEDEETRRQEEKIQARMAAAQEEFDRGMDQIRAVRATDTPLGELRMKFHEAEVDQFHAEMMAAKVALTTAKEEYVALKSSTSLRIGNQEAKSRAQFLYAEDQIRSRERELEGVCMLYDNEMFLLKRAQDMYNREQLFLPFFVCMQQSDAKSRAPASTFDRNKGFTVLEMAVALLIGLGDVAVRAKIEFLFQMFCKPASNRKGSISAAIKLLHRDALVEVIRLSLLIFGRLGDFRPRQELTQEYLQGIAEREFLKLDLVIELDNVTSTRNGMTSVEFLTYCLDVISKSKYLCELLGTPWQFEQLSRFVVQHMSAVHQYKLGLINVNDLKFTIAKQSITARPELSRWKKEVIHERALAMGENDPLKTDYSKYLPKRRTKLLSKVAPLDHGGYRNLLHYRMEVILRATVKLQTTWRARKGRQLARLAAEKQAFYHARGVALKEAREAVEGEWMEKDAKPAHTVEKMKFEAKIRMKQVKLRTKGNAFSREQVLALLMEEAVQQAQKEVENRFREMEEELGYLKHAEALTKPLDDVDYLKDDISKALVTQVVQAKHENDEVAAVMDTIALTEELEKKKKLAKKAQQDNKQGGGPSANQEQLPGSATGDEPEQHLDYPEDKAQRVARTQLRQENMILGRFPAELYTSGKTREDHEFEMTQAFPDPPLTALQKRLQHVCVGMTDFKMGELLQELPSKRHICAYITSFRRHDGTYELDRLEQDLLDHFRMVRGARELAEALVGIADTDLEFGLTRDIISTVQYESEAVLRQLVTKTSSAMAEKNADAVNKKLVRMGYKTPGIDDSDADAELQGNPMAVLLQKEHHELMEKKKRLQEAHSRFLDAMRLWREAELSLHETQRVQMKVQAKYPILPAHRTKWAERLANALQLPEGNTEQLQEKYTEIYDVCHDFVDSSTAIARVLAREIHLPVSQKSILPVRDSPIDGRKDDVRTTSRLKYEAHDILFKICTDDHSRFENSDELSAKFGGHEVRNSALYHRALLSHASTVLIPLECVVDCGGYRVLCSSKVPIEIVSWNEAGTTIQKVTKQLVHGTENSGKTITFQSKELDNMLAEAAAQLNLSRHGVRGYHDLTSKILHAPADMLGYINADKRYVLVNFARAMPPEDPEITTHLCGSTRGMSILWRQLRPEFVASFKVALSSDALSSMTYCTPDWLSQAMGAEDATRELVETVVPNFARKLSQKSNYFTAATFHLTNEMHRHGINMRHLGLLRRQFPVALSGTATLQYSTGEIQTTEDFTREVERGAPVYILGKSYVVSRNSKHRYDAQCITLTEVYMGNSIQNVTVFAGRQDCLHNAAAIRDRLLVEMVARTLKNIARHFLRSASRLSGSGLTPMLHRRILIHCLNLFTGSERGSEGAFWKVHLYEGIRVRFGLRAVSEVDQQNMRRSLLPHFHAVVSRMADMMGIHFRVASLLRLKHHPDCYTFTLDDLDDSNAENLCRVKHNLAMLHFSMASLLLLQATVTQATSYKQLVISDRPSGYWTLCERRGLAVAVNSGTYGKELNGRYLAACTLEAEGPVANIDLNRAVELRKEKRSYIAFPVVPHLYPADPSTHVALEAWCKCDGHASTRRVVLTIGRFTISALKANHWAFSFNVKNIDILAFGAQVELHKWTHLVGTYDGTMLRLYVNGFLQNEVDVESVVGIELAKREAVIAKTRQDIADLEEEARGKCFKEVDREMQQFFATKDGKRQIKAISQKLLDEHEFRVRLSKAATSAPTPNSGVPSKGGAPEPTSTKRDLSKVTRADFEPLAKKQILREQFERRVESVVAEFKEMRHRVNEKIVKELEEQSTQDARELRIGCLSSASRRDGKYFFHGCIAHVAYYNGNILTRDQVNAHYVMGVRDRAHTSDDLFVLASSRFARALSYAPDDKRTLERFAENICASLKYDLDHQHAQDMYKKKVRCGLAPFIATENVHGIAEILKNLPREPAFSDLFVYCYRALLTISPDYFQATESIDCRLSLRELGRMPFKFFLGSRSANSLANMGVQQREREQEEIPVFADVIKKVLVDYPSYYGDELTSMGWLRSLQNPRAVVYFILSMEAGEDVRYIDLKDVKDVGNEDMDVVVKNNRFALGFALARCSQLNDFALMRLALCCTQIEELDLSYCSLLTDAAMNAVGKHCTRLKKLLLVHCHLITDIGVEAAVKSNQRLEELGLSYCERVSERCMATIGSSCPNLAVLEVEMCVQLSSVALKLFVGALVNPTKLRKLNLAGCHRVADDGFLEIAKKCTRLQKVNVRLCDKLTDSSLRVLTHNCLELEVLNLEDVVLATHKLFQFDQEGDGRGVVDKNLLKKMRELNLSGCTGMNDLALGHVGHRAKRIEALTLAACTEITDQGLRWLLVEDMLDKSRCGEQLEHLDVSYCPQLTASGIHHVVLHCPKLVSLNLSGCIHLSDENLVSIIDACSKLVRLELGFCRDLTDTVLLAIAKHLSLEVLNVGRCVKVTDDGMREIAGQLTVLRKLNVSACKRLTEKTLLGLLEACPLLEELDVTHCPFFPPDVLARFVRRKVKIVCAKVDEVSVAEAVEKRRQLDVKTRRSARTPGRDDSPREESSHDSNGGTEVDAGGPANNDARIRHAVVEAKKPTRTARLPGSESTLPIIHQRTRDRDPSSQ